MFATHAHEITIGHFVTAQPRDGLGQWQVGLEAIRVKRSGVRRLMVDRKQFGHGYFSNRNAVGTATAAESSMEALPGHRGYGVTS